MMQAHVARAHRPEWRQLLAKSGVQEAVFTLSFEASWTPEEYDGSLCPNRQTPCRCGFPQAARAL